MASVKTLFSTRVVVRKVQGIRAIVGARGRDMVRRDIRLFRPLSISNGWCSGWTGIEGQRARIELLEGCSFEA